MDAIKVKAHITAILVAFMDLRLCTGSCKRRFKTCDLRNSPRHKLRFKPIASKRRNFFKCAFFFEQMCGAWDNLDFFHSLYCVGGFLVQFDNIPVEFTNDEQSWRGNFAEMISSEVGPSPTRNHGVDTLWAFRRGNQS